MAGAVHRVLAHPDPVRIRLRRARVGRLVVRTAVAVVRRGQEDAATEAASRAGPAPRHPAEAGPGEAGPDGAVSDGCVSRNELRARSASRSTGTTCDVPESSEPAGVFDGTKSTGGRPGIDGGGSGGLRRVGRVSGSKCDSSGPVQPSSLRKVSSGSGTPESPPELTQGNFDRAQVSTTTRPACRIRP